MEKHDTYDVLDFGTSLIPGSLIKIEHSVSSEKADLSNLISQPVESLQTMREESAASEQAAFEIVLAAVHQWEKQAAITQCLDRAIHYLQIPISSHTKNQWVQDENGEKSISNMVYKMTCRLQDNSHWDLWKSQSYKSCWSVRWGVYTNSPKRHGVVGIAGQSRDFKDRESAEKYLRGRIKAYSHLFTEISPPVPKEYIEQFKVNNLLLPGYTVEGQEQQYDKAAAKESESLEGGVFTSASCKTSILEKLSCSKGQEKTQLKTKDVNKQKKEDLQR